MGALQGQKDAKANAFMLRLQPNRDRHGFNDGVNSRTNSQSLYGKQDVRSTFRPYTALPAVGQQSASKVTPPSSARPGTDQGASGRL